MYIREKNHACRPDKPEISSSGSRGCHGASLSVQVLCTAALCSWTVVSCLLAFFSNELCIGCLVHHLVTPGAHIHIYIHVHEHQSFSLLYTVGLVSLVCRNTQVRIKSCCSGLEVQKTLRNLPARLQSPVVHHEQWQWRKLF